MKEEENFLNSFGVDSLLNRDVQQPFCAADAY